MMKISDPHPRTCTNCGADQLQKIISPTSFILKGQGWYETDFKNSSKKPSPAVAESPGKEGANEAASTPESAPESPAAPKKETDTKAPVVSDTKPSSEAKVSKSPD
jgi:predicted nucleic acid-binding Zn ribbon protein